MPHLELSLAPSALHVPAEAARVVFILFLAALCAGILALVCSLLCRLLWLSCACNNKLAASCCKANDCKHRTRSAPLSADCGLA